KDDNHELHSFPTRRSSDLHVAKYQEKYIEQYDSFRFQVLIVDDIFGLNIKNQALIAEYSKFKIREFTSLERNELIRKWIEVKERSEEHTSELQSRENIVCR